MHLGRKPKHGGLRRGVDRMQMRCSCTIWRCCTMNANDDVGKDERARSGHPGISPSRHTVLSDNVQGSSLPERGMRQEDMVSMLHAMLHCAMLCHSMPCSQFCHRILMEVRMLRLNRWGCGQHIDVSSPPHTASCAMIHPSPLCLPRQLS